MTDGRKLTGPRHRNVAIITLEEAKRVDRFVMTVDGRAKAAKRLGVGEGTVTSAVFTGSTLLRATRDRLFEALAREERAA
ncbi:MAG: hypothetical protein KF782_13800 [Labilithrix sp.]|nr:hypothetical protein [Labilithrix sp.]